VAFIDKRDSIRRDEGRAITRAINGNKRERYRISIPAIGEAFNVINEKSKDNMGRKRDAFKELERLLDAKTLEIMGLGVNGDAFGYAKDMMEKYSDGYPGSISPMDALIVGDAIIDPDCEKIYTTDNNLLMNSDLQGWVNEMRTGTGFGSISFSAFRY
jgi:hypothetical protein